MKPHAATVSAVYVVKELIPKLNAVEKHIEQAISVVISTSQLPAEIERYTKLQAEFQLELAMIRMNLEHLLKRYCHELEAAMNDPRQDVLLTLDQHESVAVDSARVLYQRVQAFQTEGIL
ncbi:hypothetical protein LCGC14_0265220 [marine sediment metagenome]|uniref:Uncharacterized protein n=1 Tax=marine sediment metagenome TaxID=412755 RepID=A0A0F9UH93_9ZZZZ|nr:hypothetical protein [Halomonas sp.]HDZ49490.1 hypothetical protein [Halomonas sp.]HEB03100.1 hypothetical protein [Halomonas sp.]